MIYAIAIVGKITRSLNPPQADKYFFLQRRIYDALQADQL
jgi:hypothetical protein